MASLGEVGGCLNRVLNKAAEAGVVLQTAAELAEEAQDLMKSAAEGSLQADVDTANVQFDEAVKGIARLHRYLGMGVDGVARILHRLELDGSTPVSTGAAQMAAPPPKPTSAEPLQRGSREHIDRLRRTLPPPVQPRSGQKTYGRWFTDIDAPDAPARESMSGHDEWWEAAEQYLLDMGVPGTPVTAADVEIKIAVHMARSGIQHATVVLNNMPCKGRFGCDTLVPIVLPEGSSLTVHVVTADGQIMRKTYTGGAAASWS